MTEEESVTTAKPTKYKDTKITNRIKVARKQCFTNKVSKRFYKRYYSKQESNKDFALDDFAIKVKDNLFGDAFNDYK